MNAWEEERLAKRHTDKGQHMKKFTPEELERLTVGEISVEDVTPPQSRAEDAEVQG